VPNGNHTAEQWERPLMDSLVTKAFNLALRTVTDYLMGSGFHHLHEIRLTNLWVSDTMGSRAVSKKADRTAYDALINDALINDYLGEAANLFRTCRLCCGLVVDLLRGNWYNGFWPLSNVCDSANRFRGRWRSLCSRMLSDTIPDERRRLPITSADDLQRRQLINQEVDQKEPRGIALPCLLIMLVVRSSQRTWSDRESCIQFCRTCKNVFSDSCTGWSKKTVPQCEVSTRPEVQYNRCGWARG